MDVFQITVDGHPFKGYQCGDRLAPKLVFFHGMTGDANSFSGIVKRLKERYHCILVDLPGHGGTPPFDTAEEYRFSFVVEKLQRVISEVTDSSFYVVGHSWGGDLALHLAKKFPETVKGVVLIDGGYVFPEHTGMKEHEAIRAWDQYIDSARYESWSKLVEAYKEYTTSKWNNTLESIVQSNFLKSEDGYALKADRLSLHATIKAFYAEPCSTTYRWIRCPVLLMHATVPLFDTSRASGIENIKKCIERIKVVGLEHTKHNVHWDRPEDVIAEILRWVGEFEDELYRD